MELKFNVAGQNRKALVKAVGEILGVSAEYKGAPTFAYKVGGYTIDKNGTLTGGYNLELAAELEKRGFSYEIPETEENAAPDKITLEYPKDGFTTEKLGNLRNFVNSKGALLKKAFELDELPIEIGENTLKFAWFPAEMNGETENAYKLFIEALCETVKKKARIMAQPQENYENEKYAMRVWLLGLGLIGEKYALTRKLIMAKLSGDGSWRYDKSNYPSAVKNGEKAEKPPKKEKIHKEVISVRLTPEILEKLGELAQNSELLTTRNMLIETAVIEYLRSAGIVFPKSETGEFNAEISEISKEIGNAENIAE